MSDFFVYILKCSDDSYYVGHTDNIEKRLEDHMSGSVQMYTATRLPVQLMYSSAFERRVDALAFEIKIKKWSRAKKEALIRGDFEEIKRLSRKKFK